MEKLESFKNLGLSEETLIALKKKGFEEPTSIQKICIPLLLKDQVDVVGQAQTGTGKTAAFALPIIETIDAKRNVVQALILTPTRELALQVSEEINSLKGTSPIQVAAIYGGQSIDQQIKRLNKGVQIVVGTPGRVIDHINRKKLRLGDLSFMILDEADEMLNMGFIEDIELILESTPKEKRMLLFSATMPKRILNLAENYMGKYEYVKIKNEQLTTNLTDQIYFEVLEGDKFEALSRIIDVEKDFYGLVFCRTKIDVDRVSHRLVDRGYDAEGLHGDISQNQRELIFKKFKSKKINVLVATDVAARGIDVSDLTHVINYSLPQDPESYVHRIGRTGRAGKEGTAITFISPSEYRKLVFIKKVANTDIRKEQLPEIQDIIDVKKDRIKEDISKLITKGNLEDFEQLAQEITKEVDPNQVIAALLKHVFQDELDESSYSPIKRISSSSSAASGVSVDRTGQNRLFVAKGKQDGMTKQSLVEFITQNTGVKGNLIDDVRVFDVFSFVSVPFKEAEIILNIFKKLKKGKLPLVVQAKPQK
ncbi:MAG: RNA helicase [Candidatus Margulisbacteria bacterium GWF2_35_9]|nr:MAG: RNA helicase [Candidatus Margulisbacteria bacterium GWF2_35_9]